MADILLTIIVALISGAIASLIAPWVNWGIEKRRQKLEHRRALVKEWREMVVHVQSAYENNANMCEGLTFYEMFERQSGFLSLEPNLSDGAKEILKRADMNFEVVQVVHYGGDVNRINPIDDFVARLRYRIGKIEQDWDLV